MSRSAMECWDCVRADPGGTSGGASSDAGGMDTCTPGQRLLSNEILNARDLGGTVLGDGRTVACGQIYRGAVIANLSADGCAAFGGLGIRTVVDLRMPSERASVPEAACVSGQAGIVLAPMPIPYSVSPADYIADLDTTDSVRIAFAAFGDPGGYPTYFHCTYGRDRSGVLAAVLLLALGATRAAVMAEYELSMAGGAGAYPDSLRAVLDEIERRGGVEAYLASAGVSGNELAAVRVRLISGNR